MEENYSDAEHIVVRKKHEKFLKTVKNLQSLVYIMLIYGLGITAFGAYSWKSSASDIIRAITATGIVSFVAALIGFYGCQRTLQNTEVIRITKVKVRPGQDALILFFYFNFLLICSFLLFGTWCFFFQDDATAWLEGKYSDKEGWEKEFNGESLSSVQSNARMILTISGVLSLLGSVLNFASIYYSMKISMAFEAIHTILQVQNLVIVLISFLVIYAGNIAKGYYLVPQVSVAQPEFLPLVFVDTGVAMITVAYLGYFASKSESKVGLLAYILFCGILLANFIVFTLLLKYGSQELHLIFEEHCHEIMPFFHRNFFQSFGCTNKYISTSNEINQLKCPKEQITSIWEPNVGINIEEQSQNFGCLNQRCCVSMISFVKGKFNFLAAFCIVALFFITVAIMNAYYMYKKIKKYNTRILSHKRDDLLLFFMVVFTVALGIACKVGMPEGPKGMPQPELLEVVNVNSNLTTVYIERTVGIGRLNEEGWWNFDSIDIFKSLDDSIIFEKHAEVTITSTPSNGEFRLTAASEAGRNLTAKIETERGRIKISGTSSKVEEALAFLEFRPGCIFDPHLSLDIDFTIQPQRELQTSQNSSTQVQIHQTQNNQTSDTVQKSYHIALNQDNGQQRNVIGKLIESSGKEINAADKQGISLTVLTPFFKECPSKVVQIESNGLFQFKMPLLNNSVPYTMRVHAYRYRYLPIEFDFYIGGFQQYNSEKIELGQYLFIKEQNQSLNVTGRLFEAFNNKTFANDYSITVYQGYSGDAMGRQAYEKLDFFAGSTGEYYTGFFELFDLTPGSYIAISESKGFINNFYQFYALPQISALRAFPMVPSLEEGQIALVLTWGQQSPKDLDIHVEFIASHDILCQCDFTMRSCGGVRYMTDTMIGGEHGADVVKFDFIGDYQYLVYVSIFKHRTSPKVSNTTTPEMTLGESQAQLKIFAPHYQWPVMIFDVPSIAHNPSMNYWSVFCFNGKEGLNSLKPLNSLSTGSPDSKLCEKYFGTPTALQEKPIRNEQQESTQEGSP